MGARLEGDSGFVNLMNIKTAYFEKIKKLIDQKVKEEMGGNPSGDLYDKLYTFFDSYFSDGGAIFFSSTPVYKNIYAQVYNPREDTALFWKTSKLYYVKSEANYKTIKNLQIGGESEILFDFHFDASLLRHKQANEKKELEFYFTGIKKSGSKKTLKFRVFYKNDNDYKPLAEILRVKNKAEVLKKIFEGGTDFKNEKIKIAPGLDLAKLGATPGRGRAKAEFAVLPAGDLQNSLILEAAICEPKEIEKYLGFKNIVLEEEKILKAFKVYKKQTEIDYFVHKDAKSFLREQFDLYSYQHLAGNDNLQTLFSQESLDYFKKLKIIAHLAIDYIGNFEDELKSIWLKPKFARKSNYVLTLDRLGAKTGGIEAIAKIVNHKNFKDQIAEWQMLGIADENFDAKKIISAGKLSQDCQKLPIDTKFFKNIEAEIIALFDDLDNELDGRLIKSDNFQALNTLLPKYREQIQTIYIDPPFNTGDDFAYMDKFQDSTWLSLMENRFELSIEFLKNSGSYLLHLDENADDLGKILVRKNLENDLANEIIWDKGFRGTESKNIFQHAHDTIFLLKKSVNSIWNQPTQTYKDQNLGRYNQIDESGKKYALVKRIRTDGSVYYGKTYPKEEGKSANDVISYIPTMASTNRQRWADFKTQKPEELLQVFIEALSNTGEIILDFFGGSGTTVATAQKSKRKWMGVEMGQYFNDILLTRMKEVLANKGQHEPCGISKDVNWQGGGFFKYYELEQYEEVLRNAAYNPAEGDLANIDFSLGEKQARAALDIDLANEKAQFAFEKLYPDADLAETISNLLGKKIKQIKGNKVVFGEGDEIDLAGIDFAAHPELKKLIYW